MPADVASLGLGPLTQLAWVVPDLAAAERSVALAYGCTPWVRLEGVEFGADTCTYRGEPASFVADVSLAYRDDLQLELIRPVSGASLYDEFLRDRPTGGLHHVCFAVDDVGATLDRAAAAGLDVVQQGSMADGAVEFAYLDLEAAGASLVEVARIAPAMQEFFDGIRETR